MTTTLEVGEWRYEIREDMNGKFNVLDVKNHKRIAEFEMFADAWEFTTLLALKTAEHKETTNEA